MCQDLISAGLLEQEASGAYRVPELGFFAFYVGDYDSAAWMYG
jgi:hypothetical protein